MVKILKFFRDTVISGFFRYFGGKVYWVTVRVENLVRHYFAALENKLDTCILFIRQVQVQVPNISVIIIERQFF